MFWSSNFVDIDLWSVGDWGQCPIRDLWNAHEAPLFKLNKSCQPLYYYGTMCHKPDQMRLLDLSQERCAVFLFKMIQVIFLEAIICQSRVIMKSIFGLTHLITKHLCLWIFCPDGGSHEKSLMIQLLQTSQPLKAFYFKFCCIRSESFQSRALSKHPAGSPLNRNITMCGIVEDFLHKKRKLKWMFGMCLTRAQVVVLR